MPRYSSTMVVLATESVLTDLTHVLNALTESQSKLLDRLRGTRFDEVITIAHPGFVSMPVRAASAVPQSAEISIQGQVPPPPTLSATQSLLDAHTARVADQALAPQSVTEPQAGITHTQTSPLADTAPWPAPATESVSPKVASRDYDFFAELDAQLARLAERQASHHEQN